MGIYDRDYYREDKRWGNPFERSRATAILVIFFIGMMLIQMATTSGNDKMGFSDREGLTGALRLDVENVLDGEIWRVLTYSFVTKPHNFLSFVATLLFLIFVGYFVEDIYGWKEYLAFFLFTSLFGGLVYTAFAFITDYSEPLYSPASAITSILIVYALHYPRKTITIWVVPIPVWAFVAFYIWLDVTGGNAFHVNNKPAIALHTTGALFGFLYHTYTLRILNWIPSLREQKMAVKRRKSNLRLFEPAKNLEPEPAAALSSANASANSNPPRSSSLDKTDEQFEAKLDAVLQKVSDHGKESLTESEREILLKASEYYKKRKRPT